MNKKIGTCVFMLLAIATSTYAQTKYGIKVGGVDVTSSNRLNVTGSNIKAYDTSKPFKVEYEPYTHTLSLDNVKIERTGSYNRAILNEHDDGTLVDEPEEARDADLQRQCADDADSAHHHDADGHILLR